MKQLACTGCGGVFPDVEGPTHPYVESSPGCWACYGEVLAREYSDARYFAVHQLTVDAYAVQHPGRPSRQAINSVALHLISLCAVLEQECAPHRATTIIQAAARDKGRFRWLGPPPSRGKLTVADVHRAADADEYGRLVRAWAEAAWGAWSDHHEQVRAWLAALPGP